MTTAADRTLMTQRDKALNEKLDQLLANDAARAKQLDAILKGMAAPMPPVQPSAPIVVTPPVVAPAAATPADLVIYGRDDFQNKSYGTLTAIGPRQHSWYTDPKGVNWLRIAYTNGGGGDQISGAYQYGIPMGVRTLHLRFTLRLNGPLSNDGVIQKLGRWRIQDTNPANAAYWKSLGIDPNDIDAGALVIQNGHLMFNGGSFSAQPYNIISLLPDGDSAYGPDTFIDRARTIDATLTLAPTMQWFSFWVDGVKQRDYVADLTKQCLPDEWYPRQLPQTPEWHFSQAHILGTLNHATPRVCDVRGIVIANRYDPALS